MSNKLSCLFSLVLVLALVGFTQAELLVNPDFEDDIDFWKSWGSGSGSGTGGYTWSSAYSVNIIEDGTAQSGDNYVEVGFWIPEENTESWGWGYCLVYQEHPVIEGQLYQISAWFRDGDADGAPSLIPEGAWIVWEWRSEAPEAPDGDRGDLLDVDGDGDGDNDKISYRVDITEEWTHLSTIEVAPPGAKGVTVVLGTPLMRVNVDIDNASFIEFGYPPDEATEVDRQLSVLSWSPGMDANMYDVYFGTDFNDVNQATPTDDPAVVYQGRQAINEYTISETLDYGTTYFWRIDEVNDADPNSPWIGDTWSFTTGNFILIEDFEDYNDYPPNEVWMVWGDGYDNPLNGSSAGYPDPDFVVGEHYLEDTIVRSGLFSMPLFYNNSTAPLSEVTRTFDSSMGNWTVDDVVTLTLFYYGDAANDAEPMYVAVDNAVVTNDDANAALVTEWTPWDIPLQELADQGVNLNSVGSMTIGFGNKANPASGGGEGHVFFDDIRLYR